MSGEKSWSDLIREQGERYDQEMLELVERMRTEIDEATKKLGDAEDEYLLTYLSEPRSHYDPRIQVFYTQYKEAVINELRKRLKS